MYKINSFCYGTQFIRCQVVTVPELVITGVFGHVSQVHVYPLMVPAEPFPSRPTAETGNVIIRSLPAFAVLGEAGAFTFTVTPEVLSSSLFLIY